MLVFQVEAPFYLILEEMIPILHGEALQIFLLFALLGNIYEFVIIQLIQKEFPSEVPSVLVRCCIVQNKELGQLLIPHHDSITNLPFEFLAIYSPNLNIVSRKFNLRSVLLFQVNADRASLIQPVDEHVLIRLIEQDTRLALTPRVE